MPRRRWSPTDRDRRQVEAMAAYGIPEARIADLIEVDPKTMRRHCRKELDHGATKVHAKVAQLLVASILGERGEPDASGKMLPIITDDRARATLIMFYCKTRMGWRETSIHEVTGKDGGPIVWQAYPEDEQL